MDSIPTGMQSPRNRRRLGASSGRVFRLLLLLEPAIFLPHPLRHSVQLLTGTA